MFTLNSCFLWANSRPVKFHVIVGIILSQFTDFIDFRGISLTRFTTEKGQLWHFYSPAIKNIFFENLDSWKKSLEIVVL